MIRSMTGFARLESQGAWGRLAWEVRSVNHRYLDLAFKLPDDFRAIEPELRQVAAGRLSRGRVEAGLRHTRESAAPGPVALDPERLKQLKAALQQVGRELGAAAAPEPMRVLAWPGVVRPEAQDLEPVQAEALALFGRALDQFAESRAREGERLAQFLVERCDAIEDHAAKVRGLLPQVRAQWLAKLRARCEELGVTVEPPRLEQEVVLAAQRLDVEEELSRLASHLKEVRQALKRDEAIGRRLDFLMQELNREANTLSSKSQDAQTTQLAVEIKVLIEQMREQVQNVE